MPSENARYLKCMGTPYMYRKKIKRASEWHQSYACSLVVKMAENSFEVTSEF